jgi:hypothetical protein
LGEFIVKVRTAAVVELREAEVVERLLETFAQVIDQGLARRSILAEFVDAAT